MRSFFIAMKDFYGAGSQILNSHHLIHVAYDVKSMGCPLSRISAFSFENYLGKLKKQLRTPNRTLAQVCRRRHEKRAISSKKLIILPPITILKTDKDSNITQVRYKEMMIAISPPNNTVILKNNKIVCINKIFKENEILKIRCQIWKKEKPVYTYPTNSETWVYGSYNIHRQTNL